MPKNRKIVKNESNELVFIKEPTKFRLGNRKSNRHAHMIPTNELVGLYHGKETSRYKHKIARVLRLRGVDINSSEVNHG